MPKTDKEQITNSRGKNSKKAATQKPDNKKAKAVHEPSIEHAESGARLLKTPERLWLKPLTWRNRPPVPRYKPLPKARKLFWVTLKQLWQHKKLFGGIVVIYGLLNLILVRSLAGSSDLLSLKSTLGGAFQGLGGKIVSSTLSLTYLFVTSGSGNTNTSGVYQAILLIACSLAFIWALRQVLAGNRVRVRDSFYLGMYPMVPFLLVFLLICAQLLPLALGGGAYTAILSNHIAVNLWEKTVALLLFLLLALWSLRMITASVFALYIVSLPEMTPMRAYRSAKQMVYGRRLYIWRKLIFLPIAMLLLAAAIELPLVYFLTPVAEWTFFALSMLALPVVHGYLYNLYREML